MFEITTRGPHTFGSRVSFGNGGETFLLLAGLEWMHDDRSALVTFVDWFQVLVDSVGDRIDDILKKHI
jgi:hypothetical protein